MNGVKVRFLNREEIVSRLVVLAQRLLAARADVIEVSLFGSFVRGNFAPGSDADIFILLREDSRRFIDRIPEFLSHFSNVGVPVEVFPYTQSELKKMADRDFIRTTQKEKMVLDSRL